MCPCGRHSCSQQTLVPSKKKSQQVIYSQQTRLPLQLLWSNAKEESEVAAEQHLVEAGGLVLHGQQRVVDLLLVRLQHAHLLLQRLLPSSRLQQNLNSTHISISLATHGSAMVALAA